MKLFNLPKLYLLYNLWMLQFSQNSANKRIYCKTLSSDLQKAMNGHPQARCFASISMARRPFDLQRVMCGHQQGHKRLLFVVLRRANAREQFNEKDRTMKIAQIASPWVTIPPKTYGGTESLLYTLVEEQVGQGHDVTLFAPGDAKTSAKLVSFFPKSLLSEKVPWTAQLKAFYHLYKALEQVKEQDFDIVHTHL